MGATLQAFCRRRAIATSEDINEFVAPFLEDAGGHDLFLFLWSMDTHSPYFHRDTNLAKFSRAHTRCLPKRSRRSRWRSARGTPLMYEDMIYYNDHQIGKLIERSRIWTL